MARRVINKRGRADYEAICDTYDNLMTLILHYDNLIDEYQAHKSVVEYLNTARALHVALTPISQRARGKLNGLFRGNITTGNQKPWYHKYTNWTNYI
ncbi:hypothetical protein E24_00218 [Faustovirus]|nr:hypothetical protein E24_00218 [Faustovirus]AMN84126.1 hypothetical protein D5a_00216 [Faustovirus]AMN85115.1 hypothetical protein E23_00217 [Faustovirus]QBR99113.1 hypothetical protein [Faustovirus mariensis]